MLRGYRHTYGDRFKRLEKVVQAALVNGVGRIIIIDNATATRSRKAMQHLERQLEGKIVICLPS